MENPLTEVGARCYPAARSTSRADSNQRWHNFRRYLRDLKHYQTRFKRDLNAIQTNVRRSVRIGRTDDR